MSNRCGHRAACGGDAYLWPSSCATVKATGSPVSSLMLQLRWGWHIPATCDRPSVSHGLLMAAQMSFLGTEEGDVTLFHLILPSLSILATGQQGVQKHAKHLEQPFVNCESQSNDSAFSKNKTVIIGHQSCHSCSNLHSNNFYF